MYIRKIDCSAGRLTALALTWLILVSVHGKAAAATLGVSVEVLPAARSMDAEITVPLPPGTRVLTAGRAVDAYAFDGDTASVAQLFQGHMQQLGYKLVFQTGDGMRLRWENQAHRIDVQLDPVLGQAMETRILLRKQSLSAAPSGPAPRR